MFCDESLLEQHVVRKRHVRTPRKRYDEKYAMFTIKHLASQTIRGAISENDAAGLYVLLCGTTMNGPRYVEL